MIVDILVHMYKRMISPISSSFSFYQDSDFFKKLEGGGGLQVEYFFKVGADFRTTLKWDRCDLKSGDKLNRNCSITANMLLSHL